MYSDIKNAIKTHITNITGIKNVYGYEKGDLNGFPSAVVTLESFQSDIDTTTENIRKYTIKIKVYQEMDAASEGAETAETNMEALIDSIIEKFENDYTLGGLCYKVDIKGVFAYVDRGISARVIETTLDCYATATIS